MKRLITLLCALGASFAAHGQNYFSSPGTQSSTNVAWSVAPRGSLTTFVTGYGEVLPRLEVYYTTTSHRITNSLTAGLTNILVEATTGLSDGDTVLIHDVSADAYQRARIMAPGSGSLIITNDLVALTTSFDLVAGDQVYGLTQAASFPITAAATTTWSANGGNLWFSENGPTLFQVKDLGSPTTNQMCLVSGQR